MSINARKANVEAELAVVAPVIEAARLAVGQIKADHLNEIRSLKAPPDAIRDVLEGVLKLMGQADTSWNSMKKFLGGRGIKVQVIVDAAPSHVKAARHDHFVMSPRTACQHFIYYIAHSAMCLSSMCDAHAAE